MPEPYAQDNLKLVPVAVLTPRPLNAAYSGVGTSQVVLGLNPDNDKTAYCSGFEITGLGATAATNVQVVLSGLAGGSFTYNLAVPAGVTTAIPPLIVPFPIPLAGFSKGGQIALTIPALGAGNTQFNATLHGFCA